MPSRNEKLIAAEVAWKAAQAKADKAYRVAAAKADKISDAATGGPQWSAAMDKVCVAQIAALSGPFRALRAARAEAGVALG